MRLRTALSALGAVLLATASQTVPAQAPSSSASQISSTRDEWVKRWNEKNLEALLALYARDAVLLPSSGQRLTGRDAIADYLEQVIHSSGTDMRVTSIGTDDSAKLAYDSGTYEFTIISNSATISASGTISGGKAGQVKGNYLIILKRGSDGKWLIVEHALTGAPATPSK